MQLLFYYNRTKFYIKRSICFFAYLRAYVSSIYRKYFVIDTMSHLSQVIETYLRFYLIKFSFVFGIEVFSQAESYSFAGHTPEYFFGIPDDGGIIFHIEKP